MNVHLVILSILQTIKFFMKINAKILVLMVSFKLHLYYLLFINILGLRDNLITYSCEDCNVELHCKKCEVSLN